MDVTHRLAATSAAHWFSTDQFGRDVLTRCMYGAQLSLTVGFLVVIASLACGTVLGVVSGYVRRLDGLLMRVTDALMAFPDILLAIALMAVLGASLTDVVIALGTVYTPRVARVARGATLVLRELQFIEAAEALGASGRRVDRRAPAAQSGLAALAQGTSCSPSPSSPRRRFCFSARVCRPPARHGAT
jgi:peptide/nickel transport system permease protein